MRIDNFNKISQLYKVNQPKKVDKFNRSSSSDKLEISQTGRDYQIAKNAVASASDVRIDKVNDIKNRMEAGTYDVNMEEVANKLVDHFFDTVI